MVVEIDGTPTLASSRPDLTFDEDGRVSGSGTINRVFGPYQLDGESLELGTLGSTMMAGPEELMDQESRFLSAFTGTLRATLADDGSLALESPEHSIRLTRVETTARAAASPADRIDADVCIVGAGYAGLTAARHLAAAGVRIVVLEARDRVGGRAWTVQTDDGTPLDMGGTWIGPGQDAAYGLAAELGIATYPTYATGETVFTDFDGKVSRYKGNIPPIGALSVASLGQGMFRLDRMAKSVNLDEPWKGKKARGWDNRSVGNWIDSQVPMRAANHLLEAAVRGMLTADPSEISLLQFLHLLRSARGGLNGLLSIEGGYQQDRLTGGAQSMAIAMATELGEVVRLSTPVREVEQDATRVTVHADAIAVHAKRAIVAIPPRLAGKLRYNPSLPAGHAQLLDRMPAGEVIKVMTVYSEPFWRAEGLNGQSVAMDSPSRPRSTRHRRSATASSHRSRSALSPARSLADRRKNGDNSSSTRSSRDSAPKPASRSTTAKPTGSARSGRAAAVRLTSPPASSPSTVAGCVCPSAASTGPARRPRTNRGEPSTALSARATVPRKRSSLSSNGNQHVLDIACAWA